MTTAREFVFTTLAKNTDILAKIGDDTRVIQGGSMRTADVPKPYLVYHFGNDTAEDLSETDDSSRQFFQVYIHDEVGDYGQIDDIVKLVVQSFRGKGCPPAGIITTRVLETSQDLRDETLNTIFRYVRLQLIRS